MPGPLLPLIGALGPALLSGIAGIFGGSQANKANRQMAQQQMDFQERMSGTAYQRATEDMRLSGINPMLAYQQGGASSPGGATAQMQDVIGPAVSSALHTKRLSEEIQNMRGQRELMDAERANFWAQNARNTAEQAESKARSDLIRTQIPNERQHGRLMQYQADEAGASSLLRRLDADRSATPLGKGLDWVKKFRESLVGSANILMTPGRSGGSGSSARGQGGRR